MYLTQLQLQDIVFEPAKAFLPEHERFTLQISGPIRIWVLSRGDLKELLDDGECLEAIDGFLWNETQLTCARGSLETQILKVISGSREDLLRYRTDGPGLYENVRIRPIDISDSF